MSAAILLSISVLTSTFTGCLPAGHFVNVALNKPCNMSSQWDEPVHPADWAVNGDTGGFYDSHQNCIHTLFNPGWWEVDLGRNYPLLSFTVWARDNGLVRRMADCQITVDRKFCFKFASNTTAYPRRIDFNCTTGVTTGRVVRVYKNSSLPEFDHLINFCEFEVWSCSDAYWGTKCDKVCGQCRYGEPCDKVTGHCDTCIPGFKSPLCTECLDGRYGENCLETCSANCATVCNKNTGQCTCKPGWKPSYCVQECDDGFYGENCAQPCSANCAEACDKTTGRCTCKPGWSQPDCTQPCPDGTYGLLCSAACSENCDGVCDKITGHCTCIAGWRPPMCREMCIEGYHGVNCAQKCSENCVDPDLCDKMTGECTCKPGWKPPDCVQECDAGFYGANCTELCSPQCAETGCHRVDGTCSCKTGWQPPLCDRICDGGTWGDGCSQACGTCLDSAACHHVTGHCQECEKNLELPFCREEPAFSQANVGIIAGASVGFLCLVIAAAVIAVYVSKFRRRRQAGEYQPETAVLGDDVVCTSHMDYDNNAYAGDMNGNGHFLALRKNGKAHVPVNGIFGNPHEGTLQKGREPPEALADDKEDKEPEFDLPPELDFNLEGEDDGESQEKDESEDSGNDVYMTSEVAALRLNPIPQSVLNKLRAKDVLDAEFGKLPYGLQKPHDVASSDENRHNNRYSSILPYDATRVVLHGDRPADSVDYINASYIRGYHPWKTYIAAQGPKANTVEEFWKMVWQERVTHIVMLTNTQELGMAKCEEYWPTPGVLRYYGTIEVKGVDVQKRADYVIRTFDVKRSGPQPGRRVTQYHYVTWPDHSVPNVTSLVDFWRIVNKSQQNQQSPPPLLVHCSAGIGRTGLFIGLDTAMDHAQNEPELSISNIVERMRADRCNMVQTKTQYLFLHMAVLEACVYGDTRIPDSGFDTAFPSHIDPATPNSTIDEQFQVLTQTKVLLPKLTYTEASKTENADKNRTTDVLPADQHLVYLSSYVKGRNQYINAVVTPTFSSRRGCILTQLPLPHTLVDVWRLIDGSDVTTVVSLGPEVEKRCCYWPLEEKHSVKFGPFTVTLASKEQRGQHFTVYFLQMKNKGASKSRAVRVLHYSAWTGDLPASTPDLLSLVDTVTSLGVDEDSHPLLIQCIDGAARSGLFRALCDVISRLTQDGDVDIYRTVRRLRAVRPQCVASLTQYRYLYQIVQEFRTSPDNENSIL